MSGGTSPKRPKIPKDTPLGVDGGAVAHNQLEIVRESTGIWMPVVCWFTCRQVSAQGSILGVAQVFARS